MIVGVRNPNDGAAGSWVSLHRVSLGNSQGLLSIITVLPERVKVWLYTIA